MPTEIEEYVPIIQKGEEVTGLTDLSCGRKIGFVFSAVVSLLLWVLLITSIIFILSGNWNVVSYIVIAVTIQTFILYIIDTCMCGCFTTFCYQLKYNEVESLGEYVDKYSSASIDVKMHCECYHNEQRSRVVSETYRDANGNSSTRTRTVYETVKVVTHEDHEHFHVSSFRDASPLIPEDLMKRKVLFMDFSTNLEFADQHTASSFKHQFDRFQDANRDKDEHFDAWHGVEMDNFQAHAMISTKGAKRPFLMHWSMYLLFSFFLLSFPYRFWITNATGQGRYTFTKVVQQDQV